MRYHPVLGLIARCGDLSPAAWTSRYIYMFYNIFYYYWFLKDTWFSCRFRDLLPADFWNVLFVFCFAFGDVSYNFRKQKLRLIARFPSLCIFPPFVQMIDQYLWNNLAWCSSRFWDLSPSCSINC